MTRVWSFFYVGYWIFAVLNACTNNHDDHIITVDPHSFELLSADTSILSLNIEGSGNIADFSLSDRFPNLESLSILFTPDLITLPTDLNQLPHLQKVELIGTTFTELPHQISDLSVSQLVIAHNPLLVTIPNLQGMIEELSIQSNPQLTNLSSAFGDPNHLKRLNLSNNTLDVLPDTIGQYEDIVTLSVEGNELQSLPESIRGLRRLRTLDISDNPLTVLPDAFGEFPDLEELRLHNLDKLIQLPDISGLKRLRSLSIVGCTQLVALPNSLTTLHSLESLEVYATSITTIPEDTFDLTRLERVKVRMNPLLNRLPEALGTGPKLHFLMLDQNGLVEIPPSIGDLTSLSALFLDENQLEELPDHLCRMTTIEELSLAQNRLSDLCSNIGELKALRKLNLFGNPIQTLPQSMERLSHLEFLNLWDVPFSVEPTLLYEMRSLQIIGVNTPDDHPSPDIIRLMRQRLSENVQFMDPDI